MRDAAAAGPGNGGRKAAMGLSSTRNRRKDDRRGIVVMRFGAGACAWRV